MKVYNARAYIKSSTIFLFAYTSTSCYSFFLQITNKVFEGLKVAGNSFQYCLMGHYNLSLSVDAKIMVSTNCPIIGERVALIVWHNRPFAGSGHMVRNK